MQGKYVIKAGETLVLDLNIKEGGAGLVSDVASIHGVLKKSSGSGTVPSRTTPAAATFTITETYLGWAFSLSSVTTSSLAPGLYVMDARIVMLSGEVVITDPIQIEVRGSVT